MNVLFVYAHEDPKSFGAAMHNRTLSFFEKSGHTTVVSDLYASGFQAVAAKWDFKTSGGPHQNYQQEQKRVADTGNMDAFAEDIKEEIAKLRQADLIIFEFPLWWSAPPAVMKGWFDKVFALGVVWDSEHRYENGLLRGKQSLVVVSAGDPEKYYSKDGIHGATIEQHLYPLFHSTIAHAGIDILKPFIATGITAALDDQRQDILLKLDDYLENYTKNPEYINKY